MFNFTEEERMACKIPDRRFTDLVLLNADAIIHNISVDSNNYGQFLFVKVLCAGEFICFWGLGYHEYGERWITDEWQFHPAPVFPNSYLNSYSHEELGDIIQQRWSNDLPFFGSGDTCQPSRDAKIFSLLADLTDEDGAYTEFNDLGDMGDMGDFFGLT